MLKQKKSRLGGRLSFYRTMSTYTSHTPTGNQGKRWEDRPNWASCFPPRNPQSEHPPDFTGVTKINGQRFWVNVWLKTDRNGNQFASVNVREWEDSQS